MLRNTGPGLVEHQGYRHFQSELLYNFDVEGSQLKPEHTKWLDAHLVPALRNGGFVYLRAMASRTGSESYNLALSARRAEAVLAYLGQKLNLDARSLAAKILILGESQSTDGPSENARHRAVQIFLWPNAYPPEPPVPMVKYARRITSRSWSKLQSQSPGENPYQSGEAGAQLAELLRGESEIPGTRTIGVFKEHYFVVRVDILVEHNYQPLGSMYSGLFEVRVSKTITYHWGLYTPSIEVKETTVVISRAGVCSESLHQRTVRREQAGDLIPPDP